MYLQNPIITTRAEQMSIEQVEGFFVPPEPYYSAMLQKKHTIIFGSRECGKSMILKYLSLPIQVVKCNPNRIGDLDFIGIYIPFLKEVCKPFVLYDTGHRPELFDYYLTLDATLAVVKAFQDLPQARYNEEKRIIFDILKSVLKLKESNSLEGLNEKILRIQRDIQSEVENSQTLGAGEFGEIISTREFVPELCRRLSQKFNNKPIYLLMDGYENLGNLARVVNVLVIRKGDPFLSYYLKIGARTFGEQINKGVHTSLDIESDRDYDVVPLFYDNPLEIRYLECIEKIIDEHHLAKCKEKLFKNKNIRALLSLSGDQLKLYNQYPKYEDLSTFNAKDKVTRQKRYFDFGMFALLSSGVIGTFVRLIHRMFYEYAKKFEKIPEKELYKIQFKYFEHELQNDSAINFAEDEFWKILRNGEEQGEYLQRLVYNYLSGVNKRFENNPIGEVSSNSFSILHSKDDQPGIIEKVKKALKKGFEIGIFQAKRENMLQYEKSQIFPNNFSINFSLLPMFGLKPIVNGERGFTFSDFNELDKPHSKEIGYRHPVSELKKIEKKIFLAIPIKKPTWEEKARKILKWKISERLLAKSLTVSEFQKLDEKPCFDAEDIDAQNIREGALRGNEMSDYSLFEVTSKNSNVFFEVGYALGLNKPITLLWNEEETPLDASTLPKIIRETNLTITSYYFKEGKLNRTEDFFRILMRRIKKEYPGDKCYIFPTEQCKVKFKAMKNCFYVYHKEAGYWDQPYKEIRQLYKLKEPVLPPSFANMSKMCEFCYKIKSSKVILIDTVGGDSMSYFLLGFAHGAEKQVNSGRIIINLYKEDEGPISMVSDERYKIPYNIKSFSSDIISGLEDFKEVFKDEV